MDVSLNKLVGRLDVLSKSMQNLSSKLNNINITLELNSEYNATFGKIENRAKEFVANVERLIDNMSFDILIDKLFGVEAEISGLAAGIGASFKKAFDSILASFKGVVTTVFKQTNVDYSVKASESSESDWLSKITDTITKELLSGKLFKKFKNIEIVLAGGLTEGNEFLSKLIDAFALAKGGAGTLTEALSVVFGKSGGVANIVAGALIAVTNFVNMLKNGFNWINEIMMLIGTALAALGAVILGVSAGTAALVAGIVAGVATIVIVVKDNWDAICEWFSGMGEWIAEKVIAPIVIFFEDLCKDVFDLFNKLWKGIVDILKAAPEWINEKVIWLLALIESFCNGVIDFVNMLWDGLTDFLKAVPEWINEKVIIPLVTSFDDLCQDVSSFFTSLWEGIIGVWAYVSEWFNENVVMPIIMFFEALWENVSGLFTMLWENISEVWSMVSTWFNEMVIIPVVSFFEGFFIRIKQVFEGLWIIAQAVWIIASTWFNENVIIPIVHSFESLWINVSGFFTNLWNGIKEIWYTAPMWFDEKVIQPLIGFFDSLWRSIKQGMISVMNTVIGGIESGINFIIGGINDIISGFNNIVSWAAEVAEVEWGGVAEIKEVHLSRIEMYETGGYPESASLFWANEYGVPELIGTVGNRAAVASGIEITGIADAVYSTGQAETSLLTTAVNLLQEIANKNMSVNIGDREIARANYRGQKSLGSRLITEF